MDLLLVRAAQPPPIITKMVKSDMNSNVLRKIVELKWKLKSSLEEVSGLKTLKEEFTLLNQILYKIHNRFHNDKGYKDLRMYEKSMKKFLNHNFVEAIDRIISFLPNTPSTPVSFPTLAMVQHSALQVYGGAALLQRLNILALNSGLLAVQRLNLGHFWGVAAHQLACISRSWLICRHLLRHMSDIYRPLMELLPLLGEQKIDLPQNLNKFLPEDLVENLVEKESVNMDITDSVDSFLDIGVPVKRAKDTKCDLHEKVMKSSCASNEDSNDNEGSKHIGKDPIQTESKPKDSLGNIHSLEELRQFLDSETKARKISRKTCLTSSLNQEQWKTLRKEVLKGLNDKTPNKSLKLSRKVIREALVKFSK